MLDLLPGAVQACVLDGIELNEVFKERMLVSPCQCGKKVIGTKEIYGVAPDRLGSATELSAVFDKRRCLSPSYDLAKYNWFHSLRRIPVANVP